MLVSFANINNLDAATPDVWNSRYAAILAALNGNIDAANVKDASIPYGKLNLATGDIPIAKVGLTPTTTTNAGTATGSLNYMQIGTFLMYWGTTSQLSVGSGATTANYTLTFPVAFAVAPTVTYTPRENTVQAGLLMYQSSPPGTTGATVTIYNRDAGAATVKIDWIAIGKSA